MKQILAAISAPFLGVIMGILFGVAIWFILIYEIVKKNNASNK